MSGGLELPGGPGSRAAREEEARLPITRATPGVHQGVEAEAASEAPSRRGPAPKGAEAEAAWQAASRLAPSGVSGARPRPRRCLSRGTEASARMWRDFREPSLIRDLGRTAWLLTVYADGPHQQGGGADRLPRLQIVQRCGDGRNDILLSAGELVLER